MSLVSKIAPDFTASAVLGNGNIINDFNFKQYISGNHAILFFWPMDFTFVCPSELIALNLRYYKFKKRNVKLVGISCDSEFVHHAWRNTPINKGGIGEVKYVMVSDIKRKIQKKYGIEHPEKGIALRGSFLIDKNNIVRHQIVNDLPLGRNIDELIRTVDALQYYETHGEVCPAQWVKGNPGIIPTHSGISNFLIKNFDKL